VTNPLKEGWLQDSKAIKKNETAQLNIVPLNKFQDCFAEKHSNPKTDTDSKNKEEKL
jgi:hypothetical protein